jgi:hypothetical protein
MCVARRSRPAYTVVRVYAKQSSSQVHTCSALTEDASRVLAGMISGGTVLTDITVSVTSSVFDRL